MLNIKKCLFLLGNITTNIKAMEGAEAEYNKNILNLDLEKIRKDLEEIKKEIKEIIEIIHTKNILNTNL